MPYHHSYFNSTGRVERLNRVSQSPGLSTPCTQYSSGVLGGGGFVKEAEADQGREIAKTVRGQHMDTNRTAGLLILPLGLWPRQLEVLS
jgi:hypothetical protein